MNLTSIYLWTLVRTWNRPASAKMAILSVRPLTSGTKWLQICPTWHQTFMGIIRGPLLPRSEFHQGSVKFWLVHQIALALCIILFSFIEEKCLNWCTRYEYYFFGNLVIFLCFYFYVIKWGLIIKGHTKSQPWLSSHHWAIRQSGLHQAKKGHAVIWQLKICTLPP